MSDSTHDTTTEPYEGSLTSTPSVPDVPGPGDPSVEFTGSAYVRRGIGT